MKRITNVERRWKKWPTRFEADRAQTREELQEWLRHRFWLSQTMEKRSENRTCTRLQRQFKERKNNGMLTKDCTGTNHYLAGLSHEFIGDSWWLELLVVGWWMSDPVCENKRSHADDSSTRHNTVLFNEWVHWWVVGNLQKEPWGRR